MLSNPTSAINTRRRTHRRQNSTPNIEVGQMRKAPAASGLQRTNSQHGPPLHRGHRRGLSLDQPRSFQGHTKLTPTLGPISQDDISVSTNSSSNTNQAGHHSLQYRNTVVAQPSLAQPGHHHFHHPGFPPHGLGLQTQDFPRGHHVPNPSLDNISPFSSSTVEGFGHSSIPHTPINSAHGVQPPTQYQINELERHIKAVYGNMQVHINLLPTPVPTPQKRASIVGMEGVDAAALSMNFDQPEHQLDPPSLYAQALRPDLQSPHSEKGYESSLYSSPNHSTSCSPHQPDIKSFIHDHLNSSQFSVDPSMPFHMQTTLADVEQPLLASGDNSPHRSPQAVSIADLNIEGGTIEETGISSEEILQYISPQDPTTHRWTCLFPGCDAKTFGRRENIRSHVQTHLGDRQYRCNFCNKCFVRQHDLKRHAKIHSGNKPYKCPCGGGFARQDALTRHRQRGMCVGAFPDAVRKQARRGRPRKQRPDMDERVDKATKTRERAHSHSSASGGSDDEDSLGGSPKLAAADLVSLRNSVLAEVPEEDDSKIDFSLNPHLTHDSSPSSIHDDSFSSSIAYPTTTSTAPLFPTTSSAMNANLLPYSKLSPSPPGSDSDPIMPATPPLISSDPISSSSLRDLNERSGSPPTSPLCASTSTAPDLDSFRGRAIAPLNGGSIFDDLQFHHHGGDGVSQSTTESLGLSFSSTSDPTLSTFNSLDYLKNPDLVNMSFNEAGDDSFRLWGINDAEF